MTEKQCLYCKRTFTKQSWESYKRWDSRTFCSQNCYRLGLTPEMRVQMAENARRNIAKESPEKRAERMVRVIESRNRNGRWLPPRLGKVGPLDPVWKGEDATYNAKHRWIHKHWEKTGQCEQCGAQPLPRPGTRLKMATQWANLSGEYHRDRADWQELCVSCHRKLDYARINILPLKEHDYGRQN